MTQSNQVSYFAETNARNRRTAFGIKQADRLAHVYLLGKTGVGKSTLLRTLASQDVAAGRGFALIDPHGDLANDLASSLSEEQQQRVVQLNAADLNQPFGYNPLRRVRADIIPLAVSGFTETLKKLWPDAWGVRMEHVLRNTLYALLERDDATLPDILRLYNDEKFRKEITRAIQNQTVKDFWKHEFEMYPARLRAEAVNPIQNKLGALLSNPALYRILVKPDVDLRFRSIMDRGDGLIVNLSKGKIGEDSATLLGALLLSTICLAGLSRADTPEHGRRPFHVYVDEFQSFTTLMIANMMSELRKYGVSLTLAHQYIHQLDPDIRHAVFGNAGTMISFRVGPEDASLLSREFAPVFDTLDLTNLPNHAIYLKLMIDGAPSQPFSAQTLQVGSASEDTTPKAPSA